MTRIYASETPKELRFRWYRQAEQEGWTVAYVCSVFGVSRKTYYKWYRKDHPLGMTGKRPRRIHPQTKIMGKVAVFAVEEKRSFNYGPEKMKIRLKEEFSLDVSTTAIYKFMKKKHLINKPQKKQKWYTPMKAPYYATIPGENVQLDVKYVPGADGYWDYQFRFIDTVTNIQYAVSYPCKSARSTIKAFHGAQRYFPFEITGVQTDNGGEFRGVFHEFLIKKNIIHRYIPKRSAPWNGKVERANRSVDDEFYLNPNRPWRKVYQYTNWYNHERPHLGKGMNGQTPQAKYLSLINKSVTLEG